MEVKMIESIEFHSELMADWYGFVIIDYIKVDDCLCELNRAIFFENDEIARKNNANENNCKSVSFHEHLFRGNIGMRVIYMPFEDWKIEDFIFLGGQNNVS